MPHCRPATPADAAAVAALYAAYDTVELGQPEVELSDVAAMLAVEGSDRRVLEEDGRLLGYADVSRSGEVETVVDPAAPDARALQRELLAWVLQRAQERSLGRIEHWAGPRDDGAAVLLADAGFAHARTLWRMSRDLVAPLPQPSWPDAVALRPFEVERDARPVWALVQRAFDGTFGSHRRPFEEWAVHALGDDKDVVCAVEDGALVAVATVGPRGGTGHVGQLAVAQEHRGRGLALALLHEVFRRDLATGWPATTLTVDGENDSARRLYEKAGMSVVAEYRRWERDV
jgi:ribosomal protein S18 acetylase RimI-like enzyme